MWSKDWDPLLYMYWGSSMLLFSISRGYILFGMLWKPLKYLRLLWKFPPLLRSIYLLAEGTLFPLLLWEREICSRVVLRELWALCGLPLPPPLPRLQLIVHCPRHHLPQTGWEDQYLEPTPLYYSRKLWLMDFVSMYVWKVVNDVFRRYVVSYLWRSWKVVSVSMEWVVLGMWETKSFNRDAVQWKHALFSAWIGSLWSKNIRVTRREKQESFFRETRSHIDLNTQAVDVICYIAQRLKF